LPPWLEWPVPESNVAFIGVGSSVIERRSDRSIAAFAVDAALAAIADAGLTRDDIDGYVGSPKAPNAAALHVEGADEVPVRLVTERLGLRRLSFAIDLSSAFVTEMAATASYALRCGACNYVLGVRALYNFADIRYAQVIKDRAFGEDQFKTPFGYDTGGARFATRLRAYLADSGASRRDLYEVVALARRNARRNPYAIWRDRETTLEEYLAAPMIAEPLCRLDCDMPVCGAGAFIMTTADLARRAPHPPVYLAGSANWHTVDQIFERSGRRREDIDVCQIYDGFSFMLYEWLERLGWCEPNTAWKFVRDGNCEADGELPVNTFGGSLGEGRLHGVGHLREAILQIGGRAGDRQIAGAENCLVQVGPFDYSSLLVLSNDPH
jgi:acetyl-CoA acetyltransferase